MKKFKIVYVYSGYGEMGIEKIEVVEGKSLKGVCSWKCKKNLKDMLEEEENRSKEDKKMVKDMWEEFFNFEEVNKSEDYGVVGGGDENFYFVLGEKNKWFDLIDKNKEWSEEFWNNEWLKFCDGV